MWFRYKDGYLIFQLTTSRRGRRLWTSETTRWRYFNSLPHAEVDGCGSARCGRLQVFQLTTSRRGRPVSLPERRQQKHFNSLPHAEVDDLVSPGSGFGMNFNSLPHAEVDSNLSQNLWTLTIDSITNRIINLCFLL